MQIDKVRVQNFKSIQDSGWVSLEDDLTALVGENEAGKSNFLEALSYIGGDGEVPPEHLCKKSVDDRWNIDNSGYKFISIKLPPDVPLFLVSSKLEKGYIVKIDSSSSYYLSKISNKTVDMEVYPVEQYLKHGDQHAEKLESLPVIKALENVSKTFSNNKSKIKKMESVRKFLNKSYESMDREKYTDRIQNLEPFKSVKQTEVFLRGSTNSDLLLTKFQKQILPTINIRKKFKLIEDSSSITVEEASSPYKHISKAVSNENNEANENRRRRRRGARLNSISSTLTDGFNKYWDQANINFIVDYSNDEIAIKMKETGFDGEVLSYSEDRSEGFRWFLSFYLQLMSLDGSGGVDDDVILLDDPGTYLHPKGQKDLREALQKLAEDTQIIYSTHSPYMLDPDETREIRLVQRNDDVDDPDESERTPGTTVHTDLSQADAPGYDTLAPVRAALGAEYADSLFASTANLLVEGYSDETYLKRLSQVFADAADETDGDASDGDTAAGLPDECSVLQMSGAGNTTALVRLLEAEGYDYYVLLDDDRAGDVTREDLDEIGTADEQFGYVTDFLPDGFENAEIEDLFGDERLVELFTANHDAVDREAFADAFDDTKKFTRRACSAVNGVQGRNGVDADFQRSDVAKDAMAQDLDRRFAHDDWTVDDLAPEARDAFQELFADVRSAVE